MKGKKLIFISLILAMVFCSSPVRATFNTALFEQDKEFDVNIDNMNDNGFIEPISFIEYFTKTTQGDMAGIYPSIFVPVGKPAVFRVVAFFMGDLHPEIYKVIIKIDDDYRYTIYDNQSEKSGDKEEAVEELVLPFGHVGFEMVENMAKGQNVKVRLVGHNRNADFILAEKTIKSLEKAFNLFALAGGIDEKDATANDYYYPIEKEELNRGNSSI